jgi:hypothetical protein
MKVAAVSLKEADIRSGVSHVAVAPTLPRPPRPWGRIAVFAAAVSVAVIGVLVVAFASGHKPPGPVVSAAHDTPSASATAEAPSAAAAPTETVVDPSTLPLAPLPTPNVKAHPAPATTVHAQVRPRADCATPFTIDDKGHKHYKAACL